MATKVIAGVGTPVGATAIKAVPGVGVPRAMSGGRAVVPGLKAGAMPAATGVAIAGMMVPKVTVAPALITVGPGELEAVSESDWSKLNVEEQAKLKELGADGFRVWYKVEFERDHVLVGPKGKDDPEAQWITKEQWDPLEEKQKEALGRYGIDGYNRWFLDNYTAVGAAKDQFVGNEILNKLPKGGLQVLMAQGVTGYQTWFTSNFTEIGTVSGEKAIVSNESLNEITDMDVRNALITGGIAGYEQYIRDHTVTGGGAGATISTVDYDVLPPWAQSMFKAEGLEALNQVGAMTAQQKFDLYKKYGAITDQNVVYMGEQGGEPLTSTLTDAWQRKMYDAEGWAAVANYNGLSNEAKFNKMKQYGAVAPTIVYAGTTADGVVQQIDLATLPTWQQNLARNEGGASLLNFDTLPPQTKYATMKSYGYVDDQGFGMEGTEYAGEVNGNPFWYSYPQVVQMDVDAANRYAAYNQYLDDIGWKDSRLGFAVYRVAQRHPEVFAWTEYMANEGFEHMRKGEATLTQKSFELLYKQYDPETGHMKPGFETSAWMEPYYQGAMSPGTMQKPQGFLQKVGSVGFFPALAEYAHAGAISTVEGWKTISPLQPVEGLIGKKIWTVTVPKEVKEVAAGTWASLVDVTLALPSIIETTARPLAPVFAPMFSPELMRESHGPLDISKIKPAAIGVAAGIGAAAIGFGTFVKERPGAIAARPLYEVPYTAVAFASMFEGGIKGGFKGVKSVRGALALEGIGRVLSTEVGRKAAVGLAKEVGAVPYEAMGFGFGAMRGALPTVPGYGILKGGVTGVVKGFGGVREAAGLRPLGVVEAVRGLKMSQDIGSAISTGAKEISSFGRAGATTVLGGMERGRLIAKGMTGDVNLGALKAVISGERGKVSLEVLGEGRGGLWEVGRRVGETSLAATGQAIGAGVGAGAGIGLTGARVVGVGIRTGTRTAAALGVAQGVKWAPRELMRIKTMPAGAQMRVIGGVVSTASRPLFDTLVRAGDAVNHTRLIGPKVMGVREALERTRGMSGVEGVILNWIKNKDVVVGGAVADVVRGVVKDADMLEVMVDTVKGRKMAVEAASALAKDLKYGGKEVRVGETPVSGFEVKEVIRIDPNTGKQVMDPSTRKPVVDAEGKVVRDSKGKVVYEEKPFVDNVYVEGTIATDAVIQVREGDVWRDTVKVREAISESQGASARLFEWVGAVPESVGGVQVRTLADNLMGRVSDAVTPRVDGSIKGVDSGLRASLDAYVRELEAQVAESTGDVALRYKDAMGKVKGVDSVVGATASTSGFGKGEMPSRELTGLPRGAVSAVGKGVQGVARATPLGFLERVGRQVVATAKGGSAPGGTFSLIPDVARVVPPHKISRSLISLEIDRGTLEARVKPIEARLSGDELSTRIVGETTYREPVGLNPEQLAEWRDIERKAQSINPEVRELAGYDRAEFLNRVVGEEKMGGIAGGVDAILAGRIAVPGVTTFRDSNISLQDITAYTNVALMMELERLQLGVLDARDVVALKGVAGIEKVLFDSVTHDVTLIGADGKIVAKATGAQRVFPEYVYHATPNMTEFRKQLAENGYVEVDPGGWGGNLLFTSPHFGQAFMTMKSAGNVVDPGAIAIRVNPKMIKLPPKAALEAKGGSNAMRDKINEMVAAGELEPGIYTTWKHYGTGVVEYELGFTRGFKLYPNQISGYAKSVSAGATPVGETRVTSMVEHTPGKILTETGAAAPVLEKSLHVGETVPMYWLGVEKGMPMPSLGEMYQAKGFGAVATARRYLPWNLELARAARETESTRVGGMLTPKVPIKVIADKVVMANIDGELFRVADKALIVDSAGNVLVTKHPASRTLDLPAGGLAKGTQSINNVVHELSQELGLPEGKFKVTAQLNDYVGGQYTRVFVVEMTGQPVLKPGALGEVSKYKWANKDTPGLNESVPPILADFARSRTSNFRPYDATVGRVMPGSVVKKVVFDLDGTLIDGNGKVAPGAVKLIEALERDGKEVALWTHSTRASTAGILKSTGLDRYFDMNKNVVTRENYAIKWDMGKRVELPDYTFKDISKIDGDILIDNSVRQVQQQIDHGNNVIKTKTYRGEMFAPAMTRVGDTLLGKSVKAPAVGESPLAPKAVDTLTPMDRGLRSKGAIEEVVEVPGEESGGLGYAYPRIGIVGIPGVPGVTAEEFTRSAGVVPVYTGYNTKAPEKTVGLVGEEIVPGKGAYEATAATTGYEEMSPEVTRGEEIVVEGVEELRPEKMAEVVEELVGYPSEEPVVEYPAEEPVGYPAGEGVYPGEGYPEPATKWKNPPPPTIGRSRALGEERLKRPEGGREGVRYGTLPWSTPSLDVYLPLSVIAPVTDITVPRALKLWEVSPLVKSRHIKKARLGTGRRVGIKRSPEFKEA